MRRRPAPLLLGLALALCMGHAGAQVYKWKDAKGVVHYSDMPPPSPQKQLEVKHFRAGARTAPELPYELAQAAKNHPVTLYTAADCRACDRGRTLLRERGIPFAEKMVATPDDQKKLQEAGSGDGTLPLLLVGRSKLAGFEAGAWNAALDSAAYPAQKMLPRGYQYAPAEAAAPPSPRPEAAAPDAAAGQAAAQAPRGKNAPAVKTPPLKAQPDFQF